MPKSRRRKNPRERGRRTAAPLTWQAAVLNEVATLLGPHATRHEVELWASRTLGAAGSRGGMYKRLRGDEWLGQVLSYAARRRTRQAAVFTLALSTVIETEELRSARECWALPLVADLPWTQEAPAAPARAWRSSDAWRDCAWWLLEYTDHVLAVMTSRSDVHDIVGVTLLSTVTVQEWNQIMAGRPDQLPLEEVPVEQALSALARANALSGAALARACGRGRPDLDALLATRLRGVSPAPLPRCDSQQHVDVLRAFIRDVDLPADPVVAGLLVILLDFSEHYLAEDPLAWSPGMVEAFLLNWVPDSEDLEMTDLGLLPFVTWLWVRWALRRSGLSPELSDEAARVALELRARFADRCAAEREALYGRWDDEDSAA